VNQPFTTTVWARIDLAKAREPAAVEWLVTRYTPPLQRYIQRWGFDRQEAEDLAQEVFLRLLEKEALARADKARGRFRSFLLGVAKNVLRDERDRRRAKKRGGEARVVPISESWDGAAPEPEDREFDVLWLEHLVRGALDEIKETNEKLHAAITLRFERKLSYQEIAKETGRTVELVKRDLYRARRLVAQAIRRQVQRYASTKEEYEDELRALDGFLGSPTAGPGGT
jgi:RNA polymerase sigma-70 factor (ECF subfamily)